MKVIESIAAWRSARKHASAFPEILRPSPTAAEAEAEAEQQLKAFGFDVDYVEDRPDRRFGAVKLGHVRLIDNMRRDVGL